MEPKKLRVLTEFYRTPWAVLPQTLALMQVVLHRWAAGVKLSADELQAAIGNAPEAMAERRERESRTGGDLIAVLPLFGVMGHRAHLVEDMSSGIGTSTELYSKTFRQVLGDPAVGAIVLDIDSPGGSVFGIDELAGEIFAARGQKPIKAVVNSLAASAAYYVGSAADEVIITPGGLAGSIGVLSSHEDWSKHLDEFGVKVTLISAGKYKVEGNPYEPLTAEARAAEQEIVDKYYGLFVKAVARHRKDTQTAVRESYGQGRVLVAEDAVKANLADRVGTLDQVLDELKGTLAKGRGMGAPQRAHAERQLRIQSLS